MSKYDLKKIAIMEKCAVAFALIAGAFLCIGSGIMFINMTTRTIADINIRVVFEVAQLCGAGVASFAIPYATIRRSHTEMDIITSHLKPKTKGLTDGIAGIITVIVMLVVVYMLVTYAWQRTITFETTTTNHIPMWPFRWAYSLGMFATTAVAAVEAVDSFRIFLGKKVVRTQEELDALQIEGGEEA